KIETPDFGTFEFFVGDNGGHVFLEEGNRIGVLGQQLGRTGFSGVMAWVDPPYFEEFCEEWLTNHLRGPRENANLAAALADWPESDVEARLPEDGRPLCPATATKSAALSR